VRGKTEHISANRVMAYAAENPLYPQTARWKRGMILLLHE
jgi:hypothetical protein